MLNSIIRIVDTSGLKKVKCIKILGVGSFKKSYNIGDILITVLYKRKKKKLNLKKLNRILILTSRKKFKRKNGVFFKYDETSGMLINSAIKALEKFDRKKKVNVRLNIDCLKEFKTKKYKALLYFSKKVI